MSATSEPSTGQGVIVTPKTETSTATGDSDAIVPSRDSVSTMSEMVTVVIKNSMNTHMKMELVYGTTWSMRPLRYTLHLAPGEETPQQLSYIHSMEMLGKIADIGLSSNAFEGMPKTAYFVTSSYRHPTSPAYYHVQWIYDGKMQKEWDYL